MDYNDLEQFEKAVRKELQDKQDEVKRLKQILDDKREINQLNQALDMYKTKSAEYNKKKVSEHSIEQREIAYEQYKELLAMLYLKFNGVATKAQFQTLTADLKAINAIKEYGLCKVVLLWGNEVYILHSFSLSRLTDNKNAKTLRLTDSSIKNSLYINNWNIRNGKYNNTPAFRNIKGLSKLTKKGIVQEKFIDNKEVLRCSYYTFPQFQMIMCSTQIGNINIQRQWKVEKQKLGSMNEGSYKNKMSMEKRFNDFKEIEKQLSINGVFLFDIFRKGIVNVNYVKNSNTLYFDYLDKTMNMSIGKIKKLEMLLQDLMSMVLIDSETQQPLKTKLVFNIHTSEIASKRLKRAYQKELGKRRQQSSVNVKFKMFDYTI